MPDVIVMKECHRGEHAEIHRTGLALVDYGLGKGSGELSCKEFHPVGDEGLCPGPLPVLVEEEVNVSLSVITFESIVGRVDEG